MVYLQTGEARTRGDRGATVRRCAGGGFKVGFGVWMRVFPKVELSADLSRLVNSTRGRNDCKVQGRREEGLGTRRGADKGSNRR